MRGLLYVIGCGKGCEMFVEVLLEMSAQNVRNGEVESCVVLIRPCSVLLL